MWSDFQERQAKLQSLIHEQERLQRKLASVNTDILEYTKKRDDLERLLTKEQRDVVKLDEFSFANMVSKKESILDRLALR